jgi:hypothetical protein
MNVDDEYNQRQLHRMLDSLTAYEEHRSGLGKLVNNLEALIDCLQGSPGEWQDSLRKPWGILEDVYAYRLDQESGADQEDSVLIAAALAEFRRLVQAFLTQVD